MNLKLRELLWEITLKCNKNCSFCGSKKFLNDSKELSNDELLKIANNICSYPPEEITITGGEPVMVGTSMLDKIFDDFNRAGIKVKILTNGALFNHDTYGTKLAELKNKITSVGWSLNSALDVRAAMSTICEIEDGPVCTDNFFGTRVVPVSNFGTHNVFDFDEMFKLLSLETQFKVWQVQLTEGNELQLNSTGISYLIKKIDKVNKSMGTKFRIVKADNMRPDTECVAGVTGASITRNGDLVPCLSARSWYKDPIETMSEGNLLKKPLEEIWETGFRKQRFKKCLSCKNFIDFPSEPKMEVSDDGDDSCNKAPKKKKENAETVWIPSTPSSPDVHVTYYAIISPDVVFVYGVVDPQYPKPTTPKLPGGMVLYGVTNPKIHVTAYAVLDPNDWRTGGWSISSDGTVSTPDKDSDQED